MGLLMMKVSSKAEIKDRIEKLYALAQGGATEGEAKAAVAMAQKLMDKYGIKESRVNKNRYKHGTSANKSTKSSRSGNATKQKTKSYDWEDYKKQSAKETRWDREYRNRTFGQVGIIADIIRQTEKAYLLNIHMDASKYGLQDVKVSIWYPKSQVVYHEGNKWIVKQSLIMDNLKRNLGWLISHHEAFRRAEHQYFWLKGVE